MLRLRYTAHCAARGLVRIGVFNVLRGAALAFFYDLCSKNCTMKIEVSEAALIAAAQQEGYDTFVNTIADAIKTAAGGELTAEALQTLTADQVTLWGFTLLHEEVMSGGFVQLIYNGYGPFVFLNPLAKALRLWGLKDLSKLLYDGRARYEKHGAAIASQELSDDDFMALFEQYPDFDDLDDRFVESEEGYMQLVAEYLDQHLDRFVQVTSA